MVKKVFHYVCFIIASILWMILLAFVLHFAILIVFGVDPFSAATYSGLVQYWDSGGILRGKDVLMFIIGFLFLPLCFYGFTKLYRYQYMRLLTVPLNKIMNYGLDGYVAPDVNIKNLKIEEKKTLDQVIQERLTQEKKKNQQNSGTTDFRKNIIDKVKTKNKK